MAGGNEKPRIMVLGTYHMGGRGNKDVHQVDKDNVLSDQRQKEIRECVELLKEFRPTKVAVEYELERSEKLNEQFYRYVKHDKTLEADEIQQLGFRIARELKHESIYAVDWNRPVGGVALGHVLEFAEEYQPELYDEIKRAGEQKIANINKAMDNRTIRQLLMMINEPRGVHKDHEGYLRFALIGEEHYQIGTDWLSNYWYRRNLMVFANISRLVTSSEDRILVIYGAGHKYLLDQFIRESGQFNIDSVETYLNSNT